MKKVKKAIMMALSLVGVTMANGHKFPWNHGFQ